MLFWWEIICYFIYNVIDGDTDKTLFMQLSCVENNMQVANAVFGFMQIWGVDDQYRWRTRPLLADYLKANLPSVLHCLSELSVGHQRFAFDRIISHSDAPNLT